MAIPNDMDLIVPDCNFRWYEVWKSETASRLGIENRTDDPKIISNCQELVLNLAQPLREELGPLSPQSWVRLEKLEKEITRKSFKRWCKKHGHPHTDATWTNLYFPLKSHPNGEAMDVEKPGMSNLDLWNFIDDMFDDYDQLILEFHRKGVPNSGWVHMSWAGDNNRHEKFIM